MVAADTRGVFRIPGSVRVVNALYDYYCATEPGAGGASDEISSTIRNPNLPLHIKVGTHDVASTFKRFLSGLPGGILGSSALFDALVAIHSQLNGDAEFTRTKQTKLRARLIALAIGSVRSQFRRELICAVFGLLCLVGRTAETAPREDEFGRPLPTADLMGYNALGIVFGPLLVGDLINSYTFRLGTSIPDAGLILVPATPVKEGGKKERRKSKQGQAQEKQELEEDGNASTLTVDKIYVANNIAEMLVTHWREVVKHMRSLDALKVTFTEGGPGISDGRGLRSSCGTLRPSASESFVIRKPAEWSASKPTAAEGEEGVRYNDMSESPVPPSPTPEGRGRRGPPPGGGATGWQENTRPSLNIQRQRPRGARSLSNNRMGAKQPMSLLSPTAEEESAAAEATVETQAGFELPYGGGHADPAHHVPYASLHYAAPMEEPPRMENRSPPSPSSAEVLEAFQRSGLEGESHTGSPAGDYVGAEAGYLSHGSQRQQQQQQQQQRSRPQGPREPGDRFQGSPSRAYGTLGRNSLQRSAALRQKVDSPSKIPIPESKLHSPYRGEATSAAATLPSRAKTGSSKRMSYRSTTMSDEPTEMSGNSIRPSKESHEETSGVSMEEQTAKQLVQQQQEEEEGNNNKKRQSRFAAWKRRDKSDKSGHISQAPSRPSSPTSAERTKPASKNRRGLSFHLSKSSETVQPRESYKYPRQVAIAYLRKEPSDLAEVQVAVKGARRERGRTSGGNEEEEDPSLPEKNPARGERTPRREENIPKPSSSSGAGAGETRVEGRSSLESVRNDTKGKEKVVVLNTPLPKQHHQQYRSETTTARTPTPEDTTSTPSDVDKTPSATKKTTGSAVKAMAALFETTASKERSSVFIPTPMQKIAGANNVLSQYTAHARSPATRSLSSPKNPVNMLTPTRTKAARAATVSDSIGTQGSMRGDKYSWISGRFSGEGELGEGDASDDHGAVTSRQQASSEDVGKEDDKEEHDYGQPSKPRDIDGGEEKHAREINNVPLIRPWTPNMGHHRQQESSAAATDITLQSMQTETTTANHDTTASPTRPQPSPRSSSKAFTLHARIKHLEKQLEAKTDEVKLLRRQLDAAQQQLQKPMHHYRDTIGVGGIASGIAVGSDAIRPPLTTATTTSALKEQLYHMTRECRIWKDRAEAAEKRVALFEKIVRDRRRSTKAGGGNTQDEGGNGGGRKNDENKDEQGKEMPDEEGSATPRRDSIDTSTPEDEDEDEQVVVQGNDGEKKTMRILKPGPIRGQLDGPADSEESVVEDNTTPGTAYRRHGGGPRARTRRSGVLSSSIASTTMASQHTEDDAVVQGRIRMLLSQRMGGSGDDNEGDGGEDVVAGALRLQQEMRQQQHLPEEDEYQREVAEDSDDEHEEEEEEQYNEGDEEKGEGRRRHSSSADVQAEVSHHHQQQTSSRFSLIRYYDEDSEEDGYQRRPSSTTARLWTTATEGLLRLSDENGDDERSEGESEQHIKGSRQSQG